MLPNLVGLEFSSVLLNSYTVLAGFVCSMARAIIELSISNVLMQIIERKEQIRSKNVTVPVAASQMKIEQGLLEGPCYIRVFSCSSPSLPFVTVMGFFVGFGFWFFLILFFLLQKLEKEPSRTVIWQYCSKALGLF